MRKLIISMVLVIVENTVLSADSCTQEQIAEMIKQNLSQDVINAACKDEIKKNDVAIKTDRTNKPYIGMGITRGRGTFKTRLSGVPYSYNYTSSSTPIKIGYILNSGNRFELSYESMKYKFSDSTDTVSGWSIDWDFVYPQDTLFSSYWRVGLGSYECEDVILGNSESLSGVSLNFGIGGIFRLDDNFEFETSLIGKLISWEEQDSVSSTSYGAYLYLGLNLKF